MTYLFTHEFVLHFGLLLAIFVFSLCKALKPNARHPWSSIEWKGTVSFSKLNKKMLRTLNDTSDLMGRIPMFICKSANGLREYRWACIKIQCGSKGEGGLGLVSFRFPGWYNCVFGAFQ